MDDAGAILVVAFLAACLLIFFWRVLLALLLVLVLTLVFAGILGLIDMASRLNYS